MTHLVSRPGNLQVVNAGDVLQPFLLKPPAALELVPGARTEQAK
jgi:hypothetical protein